MNNKFLSDYLIQNFGDPNKQFDEKKYIEKTNQDILNIQSQIDILNNEFSVNQKEIEDIDKQISEKGNQILKLNAFIDQKSGIEALKAQIDKLSENLIKLESEKNILVEKKQTIENNNFELQKKIKKLEIHKSQLEDSTKPGFQKILDDYIQPKKLQILEIFLSIDEIRKKRESSFGNKFDFSGAKDQYPLDDFKDIPEVLQELKGLLDAEKNIYVESKMDGLRLDYAKKIRDNLESAIFTYQRYKESKQNKEKIDMNVDYKYLDSIYKSTLNRNKTYFPHLEEIKELTNHPLFKKPGILTLQDMDKYYNNISKKKDVKKFKRFGNTLNTIMLDYNIPLITISDDISNISGKDIELILSDNKKRELYSKYLILDKELLIKLQRIINLFNSTRSINFKGFENNIALIDQLINNFIENYSKYSGSIQENINDISNKYGDELNKLIDNIVELVDKNNFGKDVLQQIMIFQNIIWTIYTYFEETYQSQEVNIREILDKILGHLIEKIYMETFSLNIIDDIEQKNNLLASYNDIGTMISHNVEQKDIIYKSGTKINIHGKLSAAEIKNPRILCLVDIFKKLGHFIICKNIYDITQNLFLENDIDKSEWEAGADLYTDSSDFKVPSIDPMLISPDKFGIRSGEYMFESYDISDSKNYMAYVRLFNISDFKNYEKIKSSFCKNGKESTESENIKKFLEMILYRDEDIMNTTFVFPELTPIIIDKNYEISLDGINPAGLIYIIGEKNYEMLRTYLFYNFMEANREHNFTVYAPKNLIGPGESDSLLDPDTIRVININPDMPRTTPIHRGNGGKKNFEYKRDTIVLLNEKCTTGLSGFHEARNHGKRLYAHVHNINDFPTRKNSIEKIRLDICDTYEEFLEKLEEFRNKYKNSPDLVVRVETYRSEFEKYEGAKQKVAYRIAQTNNAPSNILGGDKKKRGRPKKDKQ